MKQRLLQTLLVVALAASTAATWRFSAKVIHEYEHAHEVVLTLKLGVGEKLCRLPLVSSIGVVTPWSRFFDQVIRIVAAHMGRERVERPQAAIPPTSVRSADL